MAFTVFAQPYTLKMCSTIVPLVWQVWEDTADTTNIIAEGWWIDSTSGTPVHAQVGGQYRMAPKLNVQYQWRFDGSELFNTLTKFTLDDAPNNWKLGSIDGIMNSNEIWENVMSYAIYCKFYREYLDAADGLIKIDPTPLTAFTTMCCEGSPEKDWLVSMVDSNGYLAGESIFEFFDADYLTGALGTGKRYYTNYPIKVPTAGLLTGQPTSYVTIHESEQYMLTFRAKKTVNGGDLTSTYRWTISTYDEAGVALGTHVDYIEEDTNLQTISVGFRDIVDNLTPNGTEAAGFTNVASYSFIFESCSLVGTPCTNWVQGLTNYSFKVSRKCITNGGYLRFAFKNMAGGFDMVTSDGKFTHKTKNKFEDFEQSLGYEDWNNPMDFGNSNWANQNVERYTVTTELKKKENAIHFTEMLSSTQVYLRVPNESYKKTIYDDSELAASKQPYFFMPIVIKGGNTNIELSQDNYASIKFSFEMAVNQRNPRY